MKQGDYLLCMFWGAQVIPSVCRPCSECPKFVAMDARNVPLVDSIQLVPICPECFLKRVDTLEVGGLALGGLPVHIKPRPMPPEHLDYIRGLVRKQKAATN